jgi:metallo-beta-lactamase class B
MTQAARVSGSVRSTRHWEKTLRQKASDIGSLVARGISTIALLLAMVCLGGCRAHETKESQGDDIVVSEDVVLHLIAPDVWVHTSYAELPQYGRVPANGLLVVDGAEAMLIDLPWTDEQTAALFEWINAKCGARVTTVVPTHFHEDCMGGLREAHRRRAVSHALDRTCLAASRRQLPMPQNAFLEEIALTCGGTRVDVRYFGAGHTTDNVVAWLPRKKVLFAGCLVRSANATSLGNTEDVDLKAYPATLRKVRAAHPQAKIVVPGHGAWGGLELINHTLVLCMEE